jgi:hypothetical protein
MSFIKLKSMGAVTPSHSVPAASAAMSSVVRDTQRSIAVDMAETEGKGINAEGTSKLVSLRVAKGEPLASLAVPPKIDLTPVYSRWIRYQSTSATAESVTIANVAGAIGGLSPSVVSVNPFCSSCRITRIRAWPAAGGFFVLNWAMEAGGFVKDDLADLTIPTGLTVSGCLQFSPPPLSLASFWRNKTNSDTLLTLQSTVGTVVDVQFQYTLPGAFANFANQVVASAVIGTVYYLALDGPSTNNYRPVALSTTS